MNEPRKITVLAVSHTFPHMTKHSGYDNLFTYLNSIVDVKRHVNSLKGLKKKLISRLLYRSYDADKYGQFHTFPRYLTEYEIVSNINTTKPDIVHLAYLEDSLGYLWEKKEKLNCKLIATAHQPPSWWEMTGKNKGILAALDGLIVLDNVSKKYFEQYLPGKTYLAPHGIDTKFYSPVSLDKKTKNAKIKCLFVGNWLRDFNFFVRFVDKTVAEATDIEFHIVYPFIPNELHPFFNLVKYNNIIWHRNIPDTSLLDLYRTSDCLLLPLLNSTANNALLEAISCELPVITNTKSGINDYIPTELIYQVSDNDVEGAYNKLLYITAPGNAEEVRKKASLARKHILGFDWDIIKTKVLDIYREVIA